MYNFLKKIFHIDKKYNSLLSNIHVQITLLGIKLSFKVNVKSKKESKLDNCIAIFCGGGIGDYVILRNYFQQIKNLVPNSNLIYLAKNTNLYSLSMALDKQYIDEIILMNDINSFNIKKICKNYNFIDVINFAPFYNIASKKKYDNKTYKIIKSIKCQNKTANIISDKEIIGTKKYLGIYTNIVYTSVGMFESERFKCIIESALQIKLDDMKMSINPKLDICRKYILISPFSRNENRNLLSETWVDIINYISSVTRDVDIVLIGSSYDGQFIRHIIDKCNSSDRIKDLSGEISIALLPTIIKGAQFLISPDTGTVHIANATKTKTLCISCGSYYRRFQPYSENVIYVYPDEFDLILNSNDEQKLLEFYNNNYSLNIKNISFEKIKKSIDVLLNEMNIGFVNQC